MTLNPGAMCKKWRYLRLERGKMDSTWLDEWREYGEDGWELVSVVYNPSTGNTEGYFKQEIFRPLGKGGQIFQVQNPLPEQPWPLSINPETGELWPVEGEGYIHYASEEHMPYQEQQRRKEERERQEETKDED